MAKLCRKENEILEIYLAYLRCSVRFMRRKVRASRIFVFLLKNRLIHTKNYKLRKNIMKAYKVIKSNIHLKGLCATRNIKKGKRIIEYRGKKITHKQADEDTKYGYDITYLFTLDKKYLLDGDFEFNKARLINHSCNPNCEVLDESKSKIWITAMRNIKKNEELSYDYGFSFDCNYKDHICKCGSKNCVGFIIREGSRWRLKNQANT